MAGLAPEYPEKVSIHTPFNELQNITQASSCPVRPMQQNEIPPPVCRSPKDTEPLLVLEGAVEADEERAVPPAGATQVVQNVPLAAHVLGLPLANDVPLLTDLNWRRTDGDNVSLFIDSNRGHTDTAEGMGDASQRGKYLDGCTHKR